MARTLNLALFLGHPVHLCRWWRSRL